MLENRFLPLLVEILQGDRRAPKKQGHKVLRVLDRLVVEHAYLGPARALRAWPQGRQEGFLQLSHPPSTFTFAYVDLAGERIKVALLVTTLPYSDAVFIQALPRGNARKPLKKATSGRSRSSARRSSYQMSSTGNNLPLYRIRSS